MYLTIQPQENERRERTAELFRRAQLSNDQGAQQQLIYREIAMVNLGVAESIAHRYRNRGERIEDLEQVAYLGLMKAVHGFDPDRGKDFLSYAVPTISGELKRHFRDHCWWVRPPRRIQELQGRIAGVASRLTQDLGRQPQAEEYAAYLDVSVDDVNEALSADGCFTPSSLDIPTGADNGGVVSDLIGVSDRDLDRAELHVALGPLVRELDERDRQVVAMRFYRGWTQQQIAEHVGITQTQVSRVLRRILQRLRRQLAA